MRKWAPLAAVCLGTFMLLVDVTIVNVALPDMAVDLHTSFSSLQWVIDSYAVALAALLMGLGSLADLRGRRRVYLAGLAMFAAASLASGLAASPGLLIAARAVQGVGGAAMFATTIALLNASYQGRDRGTAFGVWGAVAGGSAAVGPVLGGLLTETLSWRWIFFVNLPVSAAAIALTLAAFGADRRQATGRFDLAGVLAFTAGAAATTFGLVRASSVGWAADQTIGLIAAGLAAFVVFVLIERRARQPLLQVSLLRRPAFAAIMIAALLLNAAAFAYLAYSSLWLQTVLGLSPVQAGLAGAAPLSLSAFVVSAAIGRFLHASNPRWIIGGGMALVGAGALPQAGLGAGSVWTHLVPGLIVAGIGVGLATPTLVSSAMSAVPVRSGGMAAGAVNTMRQLGYAFGIAVLGSVFSARVGHVVAHRGGRPAVAQAISGGQAQRLLAGLPAGQRDALDQVVHAASAAGLNAAFLLAGALGLVGSVIVLAAMRRRSSRPSAPGAQGPDGARVDSSPAGGGPVDCGTGEGATPQSTGLTPQSTGATPQSTGATEGAPV
jgi:EmrB/QacA subfamily drug resistance transporter